MDSLVDSSGGQFLVDSFCGHFWWTALADSFGG